MTSQSSIPDSRTEHRKKQTTITPIISNEGETSHTSRLASQVRTAKQHQSSAFACIRNFVPFSLLKNEKKEQTLTIVDSRRHRVYIAIRHKRHTRNAIDYIKCSFQRDRFSLVLALNRFIAHCGARVTLLALFKQNEISCSVCENVCDPVYRLNRICCFLCVTDNISTL